MADTDDARRAIVLSCSARVAIPGDAAPLPPLRRARRACSIPEAPAPASPPRGRRLLVKRPRHLRRPRRLATAVTGGQTIAEIPSAVVRGVSKAVAETGHAITGLIDSNTAGAAKNKAELAGSRQPRQERRERHQLDRSPTLASWSSSPSPMRRRGWAIRSLTTSASVRPSAATSSEASRSSRPACRRGQVHQAPPPRWARLATRPSVLKNGAAAGTCSAGTRPPVRSHRAVPRPQTPVTDFLATKPGDTDRGALQERPRRNGRWPDGRRRSCSA